MTTTTLYLVRHAWHERMSRVLCGRMPGVGLADDGIAEARRAAERLCACGVSAIFSSPLDRARQTAAEIARVLELEIVVDEALNEIDLGEWTGRSFDELNNDPAWRQWNSRRDRVRAPGGEAMSDVQQRLDAWMARTRENYPESGVVAVSHGDVIKAAVCQCLGLPTSRHYAFEIGPASTSVILTGDWGSKVCSINEGSGCAH